MVSEAVAELEQREQSASSERGEVEECEGEVAATLDGA